MFMFIKVAAISSVSAKHNGVFVFLPFRWSDCFLFVCLFFFSRPPVAAVKESYGRKSKGLPGLPSVHRSARKVLFPNDAFSEGIQWKDCL